METEGTEDNRRNEEKRSEPAIPISNDPAVASRKVIRLEPLCAVAHVPKGMIYTPGESVD